MKELFGKTKSGEEVYKYTIKNGNYSLQVLTYGAAIHSLKVPNKDNELIDVVLGYKTLLEYEKTKTYYGMCVGRVANRIKDAKFILNGIEYNLEKNEGENTLHSGYSSFCFKNWDCEEFVINENPMLKFSIKSYDGEGGFPSNVEVACIYTLTKDGQLVINYEGQCDKDTIMNLTNHSYFNLSGDYSRTILDHQLQLDCDKYVEVDEKAIPTGEILSTNNTAFDFNNFHKIGERINQIPNGYDHTLCFNDFNEQLAKVGEVRCDYSKVSMEIYTTMPSLQLYSGNFISESEINKDGSKGVKYGGICFETQYYPDSPNNEKFPSIKLNANSKYNHATIYKFNIC